MPTSQSQDRRFKINCITNFVQFFLEHPVDLLVFLNVCLSDCVILTCYSVSANSRLGVSRLNIYRVSQKSSPLQLLKCFFFTYNASLWLKFFAVVTEPFPHPPIYFGPLIWTVLRNTSSSLWPRTTTPSVSTFRLVMAVAGLLLPVDL